MNKPKKKVKAFKIADTKMFPESQSVYIARIEFTSKHLHTVLTSVYNFCVFPPDCGRNDL